MRISPKLCKKCEKKVKRYNRIVLMIMIPFFISSILFVTFFPFIFDEIHIFDKAIQKISYYNFNAISNNWQDNELVQSIAIFCGNFNDEELQVACVNELININFYYYDNLPLDAINQPEEILNNGGVCRDFSVLYDAIFKLMNFKTEFVFKPNHIYNKVCKENCYYLDQESFWDA